MGHQRAVPILVIASAIIFLVIAAYRHKAPEIRLLERAYVEGKIDFALSERLQQVARPFVAHTRFEGKINTTRPPVSGALNIVVADVGAIGLAQLKCNCAYVGADTIVCDKIFLTTFSKAIHFNNSSPELSATLAQVDEVFERWLASWIIGHEIGHALLHDSRKSFLGTRRSAEDKQRMEREADVYFASRIPESDSRRATFALTNFALLMFSTSYRISGSSHSGLALVQPGADSIHPPWLIRTLLVAKTMSESTEGVSASDRFYGSLLQKVRIAPNGIDLGTFCDTGSLRAKADAAMKARAEAAPTTAK
jgi:hypothetical protein